MGWVEAQHVTLESRVEESKGREWKDYGSILPKSKFMNGKKGFINGGNEATHAGSEMEVSVSRSVCEIKTELNLQFLPESFVNKFMKRVWLLW